MRRRRAVIMAVLTMSSAMTEAALAETLGDARIGFNAERILTIDGRTYVGKMWHMPGRQRHEQELSALRPVFILRADSTIADAVLPQLHTIVEFVLPKELSLLADPNLTRHPVGQDAVDGIATTKYLVDEEFPGGRATGSLWLSRDGIPMKCDARFEPKAGKPSTIHWELRHVRIGNQEAALFEVPRGYVKLPPEAAAPLLGIRLARPPKPVD